MPFSRAARRLFLALLLAAPAGPARAAGPAQVPSGGQVVLGTYYEVAGPDCRALSAPRVRITSAGSLGKAIVVRTTGQAAATARCRHRQVPVAMVLYQADKPGLDSVAWEVRYQQRGTPLEHGAADVRVMPRRP